MNKLHLSYWLRAALIIGLSFHSVWALAQCGCTHIIPTSAAVYVVDANTFKAIDGTTGVPPGSKVCFQSGTRPDILLKNFHGAPGNPITITNMCDGKITIKASAGTGRLCYVGSSSYLHFTGAANPAEQYGIEMTVGVQALDFRDLSTNIEADHLYIHDIGYSALNAKTDPTCDPTTWRGNFTMYDINFHDNYVKNTGGEGVYIGESHYHSFIAATCAGVPTQLYEHTVIGVKVFNNRFENIGRDAIQVGSCITDCTIHHNTILGFGATNEYAQQSGIQINPGTNAEVYNNVVDTGTGFGVFAGGRGGSHFYNNIIRNALQGGIICADYDPLDPSGFIFSNNTIINCNDYGIYMLSERTTTNQFVNNILIAGGVTLNATYAHVRLNSSNVKWTDTNNIKTNDITTVKFIDPATKNWRLLTGSPAIDAGKNMTANAITFDLDEQPRPKGSAFDIGAYEFQPGGPTSNAGSDKSITLPTNSLTITGSGTSATGITGYLWSKKSGGAATLVNETTTTLSVSNLVAGTYVFELRVTDINGFAFDEVTVNVNAAAANQNPTANAGIDQIITLPTNSLIINGIGTDPDGTVTTYAWTKVSGPTVTFTNADKPVVTVSALLQGVYVFKLTVTDNLSAIASDQVTVTVNAAAVNQVPVVSAGTDVTIYLPTNQVNITATASDPDGTITTIQWEKKSGGAASLSGANTLTLTASSLVLGAYKFRITVTDDKSATSFSEVNVNVLQGNQSPVVDAGLNQALSLPTSTVTLTGTASDPDGTIATYLWVVESGPAGTVLTGDNTATLDVSGLVAGAYVFSLTVTDDDGATGYDQVAVAVNQPVSGPNEIPLAIAGGNISFSLPTNSVNLYGSGFDADGTITTYSWVKASGGTASLTNTDKPTLSVAGLQAGQYSFRLTVTDDLGASDEDVALVTVSDLGTNIFPVASAGVGKIIKLPVTSVVLSGSGTDEDGQVVSYLWTLVSGTPIPVIASSTTAVTSITGLAEGNYVFRLAVTDDDGATDFNDVNVRVVTSTFNLPPLVDAGADIKIFLPQNSLTLNSTASDDGTIETFQWSKLGGPSATLANPAEQNLNLADLVEGEYSFQLEVTDNNGGSVFDIVKVTVLPASFNPPAVNAGTDQEITLPVNQIALIGTASSPSGTITSTTWTQVLGPAATLAGGSTLTLDISNMVVGTYVFKLTAVDNTAKESSDNIQVIVNPVPPNKPPVVDAGINQVITLPTSTINLTGTATDADGTVSSYEWTLLSGPNSPTLLNSTTTTLTASGLAAGLYIFRLSATDEDGDTGVDDAILFVSAAQGSTIDQPPVAYAGQDVVVSLPDNTVTLRGEGVDPDGFIADYAWSQVGGATATYTSSQDILNVTDLVEGEYLFRLTVTDTASLTAFDDVQIAVINQVDEIPKFFSPNNDGYGDTWIIRNIQSYETCNVLVFSRSGQTVYTAKPYQNNWDGTLNGKPLSDGDYYYIVNCDDGRVIKGALRIIR